MTACVLFQSLVLTEIDFYFFYFCSWISSRSSVDWSLLMKSEMPNPYDRISLKYNGEYQP